MYVCCLYDERVIHSFMQSVIRHSPCIQSVSQSVTCLGAQWAIMPSSLMASARLFHWVSWRKERKRGGGERRGEGGGGGEGGERVYEKKKKKKKGV